jgi:hypothetical protein
VVHQLPPQAKFSWNCLDKANEKLLKAIFQDRNRKSVTVGDLIRDLQTLDPQMRVMACEYDMEDGGATFNDPVLVTKRVHIDRWGVHDEYEYGEQTVPALFIT